MDVSVFFKSRFVTAQDLIDGPLTVAITRWSQERLPLGGDRLVVWFRDGSNGGEERGLPLNKTNARRLAELLRSEDLDDWVGRSVQLFRDDSVTGPAGRQGGVRVRSAPEAARTARMVGEASTAGVPHTAVLEKK
jgi:hypothetical protein